MTEIVRPERVLQGRYRLVGAIARGGMAEVWEGLDEVLTRPVAVKLLHGHLAADENFRARFRREAIAAARLAHGNVVATFDTGEDDGTAFIVMELIRGKTLRKLLADLGPLPPSLVTSIGVQVADALSHAHTAGLVHRDVKPANILVCDSEPGSPTQIKVADFGIARPAELDGADLTQPGALLGTAKYLSPEQIRGEDAGPQSDVYGLGIVLFEALTGRPPFTGDTEMATAMAHLHLEPLRPRQLRAGIPRSLEAIVSKAMAKDPADRYQSAAELASALRGIDIGEDDAVPSVTRDPTPPSGIAPTFRQTERTWLLPAGVIVLVAAALVTMAVVFSRSDAGQELFGGGTPPSEEAPTVPIAPASIHSFDPEGPDRVENEDRARLAIDGNPQTQWTTDEYKSRDIRTKPGVGLVLELAGPTTLRQLKVLSPSRGWNARVYVADAPGRRLSDWGEAVATHSDLSGDAEFDLKGTRGGAVLLWITRLGEDNRFRAGEITIQG